MTKQEQINASIQIIKAIADTIKELKSVPSGHLYAQLMSRMSLDQYEKIIGILTNAGLVKKENHLLTWNHKEAL